jgi:hypothetical protein
MKRLLLLLLLIGCGGVSPLETCLQDCHTLALARCISSESVCLQQCRAGDVLSVALQCSACAGCQ